MNHGIRKGTGEGRGKLINFQERYQLLDTIPDNKIAYIIGYIQGLTTTERDIPNEETLTAFAEVDEMKKTGLAQSFNKTL